MSEPSRPLRLLRDAEPEPGPPSPRHTGWIALFFGGWLISQLIGALTYVLVAPSFVVRGVASGVAAAERLDHLSATVAAGAPLAALALWQLPVWATQVATVALGTTGRARGWRRDLGLRIRPLDVVIGAGAGVGAQLLIGVGYRLAGVNDEGPARQLTSKGSGLAGLIGMLLLLAVAAPLVEELLFRGLLQQGLATRLPRWAALVCTAALFGVVHFEWLQLPGLFAAGLVFGGLLLRYQRLGPSIFAHMFFNASTVLLLATAR